MPGKGHFGRGALPSLSNFVTYNSYGGGMHWSHPPRFSSQYQTGMNQTIVLAKPGWSDLNRERQGAAVVELALCLPLVLFLTFATVEACHFIHLKQSLKIAAFEGVRVGIVRGANASNVQAQCQLFLDARNVNEYSLQLTPVNPASVPAGDYFRVAVSAPYSSNSLFSGWFFDDIVLAEFVEMMAE